MKNKLRKGRFLSFHKTISIFLSISLFFPNGAGYAAQNPSSLEGGIPSQAKAISIPEEYGKIEETFSGNSGKTIIYIQRLVSQAMSHFLYYF